MVVSLTVKAASAPRSRPGVVAELTARYAASVRGYLEGGGETALREASEVGASALEEGLTPLVLFSIHRDVVQGLPPQPIEWSEFVSLVTTVFVEALTPFHISAADLVVARAAVEHAPTRHERAPEIDFVRHELARIEQTSESRRRLVADIVVAQEVERRRIAGAIYDDAVQVMTAVLLRLGLLVEQIAEPEQAKAVARLESNVSEAIARLRRLLVTLAPPELEQAGLAPAVRTSLEQMRRELGLDCVLDNRLADEPSEETRTVLFRFVQEALGNARDHARASRIHVLLEPQDRGVVARVTDNGIGFEVDQEARLPASGRLGLAAMRERVELVGGWLEIESAPGRTSVACWIPERRA